jgi:hypothetical protein
VSEVRLLVARGEGSRTYGLLPAVRCYATTVLPGSMSTMTDDAQPLDEPGLAPSSTVGSISLDNLDATDFVEFCFDLLGEAGFVTSTGARAPTRKPVPPIVAGSS